MKFTVLRLDLKPTGTGRVTVEGDFKTATGTISGLIGFLTLSSLPDVYNAHAYTTRHELAMTFGEAASISHVVDRLLQTLLENRPVIVFKDINGVRKYARKEPNREVFIDTSFSTIPAKYAPLSVRWFPTIHPIIPVFDGTVPNEIRFLMDGEQIELDAIGGELPVLLESKVIDYLPNRSSNEHT